MKTTSKALLSSALLVAFLAGTSASAGYNEEDAFFSDSVISSASVIVKKVSLESSKTVKNNSLHDADFLMYGGE